MPEPKCSQWAAGKSESIAVGREFTKIPFHFNPGLSLSSKVAKHTYNTKDHEQQDLLKRADFLMGKPRCLWLFSNLLKGKV